MGNVRTACSFRDLQVRSYIHPSFDGQIVMGLLALYWLMNYEVITHDDDVSFQVETDLRLK